jgi:hypothetical protein
MIKITNLKADRKTGGGEEMSKLEWTPEYEGSTYLLGLPKSWQITVRRFKGYAIASESNIYRPNPFESIREWIGDWDTAKRIGEEWGLKLRDEMEGKK